MNRNTSRYLLGKKSEEAVCRRLRQKNFTVLEQNYRIPLGEVDIIAQKNKIIYVIEVRSRGRRIDPDVIASSISKRKRNKIFRVSQSYVIRNNLSEKEILIILAIVTWENNKPPTIRSIPVY